MPIVLDLTLPFRPNGGHAYVADLPGPIRDGTVPRVGLLLLEDGRTLGPPNTLHQTIRDFGGGAYSVWQGSVYFSSSDGSPCPGNGRRYQLLALEGEEYATLERTVHDGIVADDARLLDLILRNSATNNALFSNFFGRFEAMVEPVVHRGVPMPRTIVELGTGRRPLAALRALAEGVGRVVANDIMPVDGDLPADLADRLVRVLNLVRPDLATALRALAEPGPPGRTRFRGLEARGGVPFEEIDLPDASADLVCSVSVLEHIMRPEAVYRSMRRILRPGGHIHHSIDLRDHLSYHDPLRFLRLTPEAYAPIGTENRLRASDHLHLIEACGFEVVAVRYGAPPPDWRPDPASPAEPAIMYADALEDVLPFVDADTAAGFAAPFDGHDPRDLSVLVLGILARAPGGPR